jgi:hypothetical protein
MAHRRLFLPIGYEYEKEKGKQVIDRQQDAVTQKRATQNFGIWEENTVGRWYKAR